MSSSLVRLLLALSSLAPASAAVVAFTGGDYAGWQTWNWDAITHLGFWTEPSDDVKKVAKRTGVRLFIDGHLPDKSDWSDASKRAASAQPLRGCTV